MTATDYRTDKVTNGYLPAYESLAFHLCASTAFPMLRILEIGTGDGAGMEMYRRLFCTDDVHGVDNEPSRASLANVTIADQTDPALPIELPGPWDVIVDDASHRPAETSRTLANMWPTLRVGGLYVIEDWNFFDGEGMSSVLWQQLFGRLVGFHRGRQYSGQLDQVASVSVRHGMIVIHKGPADGPLRILP